MFHGSHLVVVIVLNATDFAAVTFNPVGAISNLAAQRKIPATFSGQVAPDFANLFRVVVLPDLFPYLEHCLGPEPSFVFREQIGSERFQSALLVGKVLKKPNEFAVFGIVERGATASDHARNQTALEFRAGSEPLLSKRAVCGCVARAAQDASFVATPWALSCSGVKLQNVAVPGRGPPSATSAIQFRFGITKR
jgi:hypothetical protein